MEDFYKYARKIKMSRDNRILFNFECLITDITGHIMTTVGTRFISVSKNRIFRFERSPPISRIPFFRTFRTIDAFYRRHGLHFINLSALA